MSPFEEDLVRAAIRSRLPKTSVKALDDIMKKVRDDSFRANACSICGRQYLSDGSNNHDMAIHKEYLDKKVAEARGR